MVINMPEINEEAKVAIKELKEKGFEAYLVGGYVRNAVMGLELSDIDITTNARPEQVKDVFSSFNVIETGIKHGTVTVMVGKEPVEITTYRKEGNYSDNRHPDSVEFSTKLDYDLSRRDFTMNALCFDGNEIIDMFGGLEDIENKVIRTIGKAEERFEEDALRILRALRFASVLGFSIEEKTSEAIHKQKDLLASLSVERVYSELKKLVCGKNVRHILIEYYDVIEYILPELSVMKGFDQKNYHHKYDLLNHTAVVVENTPEDYILRLAALFHDCGKTDTFSVDEKGIGHFYGHASVSGAKTDRALKRLKSDNASRENIVRLVKIHDTPVEENEKTVLKKLNRYGEPMFRQLIQLQRADTLGLADEFKSRLEHFEILEEICDSIIQKESCFGLKNLEITGHDMIECGLEGRKIGEALNDALEAVMEGKVENIREKLLEYVKKKYL